MTQEETHPEPSQEQTESVSALADIRDQFQQEFTDLKTSFESQLAELKKLNESLQAQNSELRLALVRSATVPPQPKEEPKTEEDLYNERIEALAKKTLSMM